jgi:hypothetical protein
MSPKHPVSTALSAEQEALVVVFRRKYPPPLNDGLVKLKPLIAGLTRCSLHRCLKRYGVSRIPKGYRRQLLKFDGGRESAHFTIESYALPGNYLFVAINSTMFVFARCFKEARAFAAAQFLEDLILRNLRNSIGRDDQLFGIHRF